MKNKRVIIVEGCDRTGKSTFISILSKKIAEAGKQPFVFHLASPAKFNNITFNNDEKSLMQLSRFDTQYELVMQILDQNKNAIIILDRAHYGEYVWAKYWNRIGKYFEHTCDALYAKYEKLFKHAVYIDYYIEDLNLLESRILESQEDIDIFTINNKTIKENIKTVYDLYNDVCQMIYKKYYVPIEQFNNINDLHAVEIFANTIMHQYV